MMSWLVQITIHEVQSSHGASMAASLEKSLAILLHRLVDNNFITAAMAVFLCCCCCCCLLSCYLVIRPMMTCCALQRGMLLPDMAPESQQQLVAITASHTPHYFQL